MDQGQKGVNRWPNHRVGRVIYQVQGNHTGYRGVYNGNEIKIRCSGSHGTEAEVTLAVADYMSVDTAIMGLHLMVKDYQPTSPTPKTHRSIIVDNSNTVTELGLDGQRTVGQSL